MPIREEDLSFAAVALFGVEPRPGDFSLHSEPCAGGDGLGGDASDDCLSEEAVVAFSEGQLRPTEIESVQAHLDHCSTCLTLVNVAVHHRDDASAAAVPEVWMTTFGAGQVVANRYRIDRFVGRGGMGEVYLAYDGVLEEPVALKTLLSTISDNPHAIHRMRCEARLARRVSHPNVCRVHDIGLHEEAGRVDERLNFLTMEFIDGERLGDIVRARPLEIPVVFTIARQLLAGLGAAHAAGVLHRDLKSDNVMVSGEGPSLRVTITDFGLSQALDGDAAAARGGHERVGSVSYMAPEQLLGQELSPATDIFAFGVVLFEMLCAELPFPCEGSSKQTALRRLVQKPVAPSHLRPGVPPALDRLVLRCLMEKPEDRFANVEEILAVLDEAMATSRPSAIYIKPWSASARAARLEAGASAEPSTIKLAWGASGELGSSDAPLVSLAAMFKA